MRRLAVKCNIRDRALARELTGRGEAWQNSTGTMRAHPGPPETMGYLPHEWHESASKAEYVIMSYNTPIAWYRRSSRSGPPIWTVPDVRYSQTTSVQQGNVRSLIYQAV